MSHMTHPKFTNGFHYVTFTSVIYNNGTLASSVLQCFYHQSPTVSQQSKTFFLVLATIADGGHGMTG